MIAVTFRIQDRRISIIGWILQVVIRNSSCDRQAAKWPPGIVNIKGDTIHRGIEILRCRRHHKKGRCRRRLRIVEPIASVKIAGLKTRAEDQRVIIRFPNLVNVARVSGKCIVIAKVERQKKGAGKLPSRIFQENK